MYNRETPLRFHTKSQTFRYQQQKGVYSAKPKQESYFRFRFRNLSIAFTPNTTLLPAAFYLLSGVVLINAAGCETPPPVPFCCTSHFFGGPQLPDYSVP